MSDSYPSKPDNTPDQPMATALPGQMEEPAPVIGRGWLRGLLFLVLFVVLPILAAFPYAIVMMLCGNDIKQLETDPTSPWSMGLNVVGMLVVLALVVLLRRLIDRKSVLSLGFSLRGHAARDLVAGLLWGFAVISAVFLILWVGGGLTVVSVQFPIGSFFGFGVLLILVAIEEEAACRGYLLINFMQSMGKGWALLVSSLLFAVFHALNPNASVIGLINIVIAGLFLGVYYVHRRNLWFPIGLHFTWNFFQGIVYGSPVSGVVTGSILTLEMSGNPYLTGGDFGFEASLVTTVVTGMATLLVHLAYRNPVQTPPRASQAAA